MAYPDDTFNTATQAWVPVDPTIKMGDQDSIILRKLAYMVSGLVGLTPITPVQPLQVVQGFAIPPYDNIALANYTGTKPGTVTYYMGSTEVAVLTMTYDGSGNLLTAALSIP